MAKTELIKLRCTTEEKTTWEAFASQHGVKLSQLVRDAIAFQVSSGMRFNDKGDVFMPVQSAYEPPAVPLMPSPAPATPYPQVNIKVKGMTDAQVQQRLDEADPNGNFHAVATSQESQAERGRKHHPRCTCGVCQAKK